MALLDATLAAVPAGFTVPTGSSPGGLPTQEKSTPLATLPFTAEQLATLATSAPLHLR